MKPVSSHPMKKAATPGIELVALASTAALKFILMDWLQWRSVFIAGACLFWLVYILLQNRSTNKLHLWGFKSSGFKQTLLFLAPIVLLCIVVSMLYASFRNKLYFTWHLLPILILYPLWGIIQQFLMLGIISQNLHTLFNKHVNRYVVILLVSTLFSLIHYPDYFLMLFSFLLEIVFISVYFKWKNLWAIGITHGWIATFILFYVSDRHLWLELFAGY
ncbi:MAG: CPBP family intramembrane metalloprotease [Marinilabiliaceae bacterium]|nr:CPBP family intramembrane metalloprotease [Marinilabiliaceae bacterium]